jgi:hypothetical protein
MSTRVREFGLWRWVERLSEAVKVGKQVIPLAAEILALAYA